ncbi:MAG: hypothetical protein N2511_08055 [Thermodesulfovibrionales bacterium]|nr:hypothetical protein [Thermodesulfovibrionales bacterium]
MKYDIEIPQTEFRWKRNYKKLEELDPLQMPSIHKSDKLDEGRKILLRMEFPITETEVHQAAIDVSSLPMTRETISNITKIELSCNYLSAITSISKSSVLKGIPLLKSPG